MVREVLASFFLFIVLSLIGLGPSMLSFNIKNKILENHRQYPFLILALAPTFGLSIITLISFPLYRYWAPVKVWGVGVVIFLIMLSMIVLVIYRKSIFAWKSLLKRDLLALFVLLTVIWFSFSIIPVFEGISRVVFISNPADSLVYMTLSESTRLVPWQALSSGAYVGFPSESISSLGHLVSDFFSLISGSSIDLAAMDISQLGESHVTAELIRISPNSLYSARYIAWPVRLATMVDLALFSQLSNIGIERLLYAFDLAASLCSASTCFSLFRSLKVNFIWSFLGSSALVFGFYNIMIFDHDAHSQLHCLGLLLLFIFLRIYSHRHGKNTILSNMLAGAILASVICAYTEFTIPLLVALCLELLYFLIRPSLLRKEHIYEVSIIAFSSVLLLFMSGQLIYLLRSLLRQLTFVSNSQSAIGSTLLDSLIQQKPLSTILGIPWLSNYFSFNPLNSLGSLSFVFTFLVAMCVLLATFVIILSKSYSPAIIVIPLISFLFLSSYFVLVKGDYYSFFKVNSIGSVMLILISGYFSERLNLRELFNLSIKRRCLLTTHFIFRMFLILQIFFGILYVVNDVLISPPHYATHKKNGEYEFLSYQNALSKLSPEKFLVHAPPSEEWWKTALLMMSLKDFHPYFQSGYLYDNSASRLFHPDLEMKGSPDYALISKKDDYLSGLVRERKVISVFEGQEYVIYKIVDVEPQYFRFRYPELKETV